MNMDSEGERSSIENKKEFDKPEKTRYLENPDEGSAISKSNHESIGIITGHSFCFTGALRSMHRNDAYHNVIEKGGIPHHGVTKDLDYLVTNNKNSGSSKNEKAARYGIQIISEEEFLDMLNTTNFVTPKSENNNKK